MELKKAMERKRKILQLVSMCLGAVLALSMILLPANAAFAQGMQAGSQKCQELERSLPGGIKEYWKQKCGLDVIYKAPDCEFLPQEFPKFKEYLDKNCLPVDMEARAQACEELAQTLPPSVKNNLNYLCGPDAAYEGKKCENAKNLYEDKFPGVTEYIEYKCEELGFPMDMEARAQACEELAQTPSSYFQEDLRHVKGKLNYYCGPDALYEGKYCESEKKDYKWQFPDVMKYIEYKCEELGFPMDMEARAQACEELAQTPSSYFKEDLQYVKGELNYYCGPDAPTRGLSCEDVTQYYEGKFPGVTKYIQYNCGELEEELEPIFPSEQQKTTKSPEIKSGEIKNGDSCKGEVSEDHGGNYTGTWRIVEKGGCGQKENGVKICDRKKGNGNVGPVDVGEGDCCYAKWIGGQSYIGSIFYDEASQTFGCDSY
ncbi:MAG: hypothetical protein AB4352_11515 [Hormoscilla sp.]